MTNLCPPQYPQTEVNTDDLPKEYITSFALRMLLNFYIGALRSVENVTRMPVASQNKAEFMATTFLLDNGLIEDTCEDPHEYAMRVTHTGKNYIYSLCQVPLSTEPKSTHVTSVHAPSCPRCHNAS